MKMFKLGRIEIPTLAQ